MGYAYQSKEQKDDLESVMKGFGKNIDYVAGWYYKAAQMMQGTQIKAALVSTNSITQGEQVAAIWKPMFEQFGMHFDFAYRTFRWDSEANIKAHVHCVIIGFSCKKECHTDSELLTQFQKESKKDFPLGKSNPCDNKKIFLNESQFIEAKNINGYLLDAPDIFIENSKKPLCDVPEMQKGSIPVDGGNLIIEAEDYEDFINKEPQAKQFIKPLVGSEEFINNKKRWCLWLVGANPSDLKKCPLIMERVQKVKEMRLASTKEATRKFANYPTRFMELRQPETDYLLVPRVSSEQRRYIPIGYMPKDVISTDANMVLPNATLYHFGVLTSNVHNAWMRAVCGRLKSDYRYSNTIVYNNFPWPQQFKIDNSKLKMENGKWTISGEDLPADKKELSIFHSQLSIINTAQAILDARAKYPDSSLADLYDETLMPPELRKAHQANDRAVMAAYGFSTKMTESECVAELFKMYETLTKSC